MSDLAIRTENLTRDFKKTRALDNLCLEVPRGIVFGFLGPNGSGKTSTIHLLLGLLEPTLGRASVLGFDTKTNGDRIRHNCGALLEHHGLYERLNAQDNLDFYGRIWGLPTPDRKARIKELLMNLGLWQRRREIVGKWSRGMKQKLAVARALLHRPELVFLDEPTEGLDPISAAALRDELAELVIREGVTVFLTTHNLAEAEKLCHQVGIIRQGKLLAAGNLDELRASAGGSRVEMIGSGFTAEVLDKLKDRAEVARLQYTQNNQNHLTIHLQNTVSVAPLVSLLVREGVEIEEVRKGKASLEEAFLSLVENEGNYNK